MGDIFERRLDVDYYPPTCKSHIEILSKESSIRGPPSRDALGILTDAKYRAIHPKMRGIIKGYSHDRYNPISEFKITIASEGDERERETVPFAEIVKIELVDTDPRQSPY